MCSAKIIQMLQMSASVLSIDANTSITFHCLHLFICLFLFLLLFSTGMLCFYLCLMFGAPELWWWGALANLSIWFDTILLKNIKCSPRAFCCRSCFWQHIIDMTHSWTMQRQSTVYTQLLSAIMMAWRNVHLSGCYCHHHDRMTTERAAHKVTVNSVMNDISSCIQSVSRLFYYYWLAIPSMQSTSSTYNKCTIHVVHKNTTNLQ